MLLQQQQQQLHDDDDHDDHDHDHDDGCGTGGCCANGEYDGYADKYRDCDVHRHC